MTTITEPTLQQLPIADVLESAMNTRQHYDTASLQELADSMARSGQLTPCTVRPHPEHPGQFELAAGHRRRRAAVLASLPTLLCIVRDMDDAQFLEVLTVDNLQRDDLHPMEEARGFRLMMDRVGYDIARLAVRTGKTATYIYDRIRLLKLTPEAQRLFEDGRFTLGHAIELSRLTARDQDQVIGTAANDYTDGGLFEDDAGHELTDAQWELIGAGKMQAPIKPVSVRELKRWIDNRLRFDPTWEDNRELFPETVALLEESAEAKLKPIYITYDHLPHESAKDPAVRTYGHRSWKRADGQEGSQVCDHARVGIVAAGPGRGQAFPVCVNRKLCLVHWKAEIAAAKKRAKALASGDTKQADDWKEQERKRQERERLREEEAKRWKKARPKLLAAGAAAIDQAEVAPQSGLVTFVFDRLRVHAVKGTTFEEMFRLLAKSQLDNSTQYGWNPQEQWPPIFKQLGIDAKAIVDQVAPKAKAVPATATAKAKGKPATPKAKKRAGDVRRAKQAKKAKKSSGAAVVPA